MEHLPSDIKNIKIFLNSITKYILNKSVKREKVNDFEDFKDVGKVTWDFISAIYSSGWNTLWVNNNILFKTKVASKFTPKINSIPKNKDSKKTKKLASVSSLPPFIPMKLPKEIKDIVKYFKKSNNPKGKEMAKMSYIQVSSSENITREALYQDYKK